MRFSSISLLVLLFCKGSFAQHCPLDNVGVLVLKIVDYDGSEGKITPYLKVIKKYVLLRHSGKERYKFSEIYPFSDNDSAFVVNPKETVQSNQTGYCFKCISYSFADENYIRPISLDFTTYHNLAIAFKTDAGQDLDLTYKIKPSDYYSLHEAFGNNYPEFFALKATPPPAIPFNNLITVSLKHAEIRK